MTTQRTTSNGLIPTDALSRLGMPPAPVLSSTRPVTIQGTLNIYLITVPIVYIAFVAVALFLGGFFIYFWYYVATAILIVGFNVLMYLAIKPTRLAPAWISAFAYFYIARLVVATALNIYSVVFLAGENWHEWEGIKFIFYSVIVGAALLESIITYLMVKHAFVLRAYAQEVRRVLDADLKA
ncbi:UNVERIFIED_CONTAM: hypothetical protein HDU68_012447 [Siphonaria sp. JEL0065]|nr:hypothetical protein HDU68_012447 [Siphonaria sp. JEL0065]